MISTVRKINPKSSNRTSFLSYPTEETNGKNPHYFPSVTLSTGATSSTSSFVSDNCLLQQFPKTFLSELYGYLMNPTILTCLPRPTLSTIRRNEHKTPRPKNPFMIFRMDIQYFLLAKSPGLNHKDISRVAGSVWKSAPEILKTSYRKKSAVLKAQHSRQYPDYRFSPKRKPLKKAKKSSKIEAKPPVVAPSFEDRNINENITSNTTNDDYDNCSCSLSVSDADTVSVKGELMNADDFGYETASFNDTGFYTHLQHIPHVDYVNMRNLNFSHFSAGEENACLSNSL